MDFDALSDKEVKELIKKLKYPKTTLTFKKSIEAISSMIGSVDVNDIVIDAEDVEYVLRAYRGRIDMNRFSVHLRFKEYHHHLIRVDINPNNIHTNPLTNKKITGSHIHIYSNQYELKDAIAIPIKKHY